jgi:hypothetical protein
MKPAVFKFLRFYMINDTLAAAGCRALRTYDKIELSPWCKANGFSHLT